MKTRQLCQSCFFTQPKLRRSHASAWRAGCVPRVGVCITLAHVTLLISFVFYVLQLAVVVVGFPATPLMLSRARFCISAGHTIEDLQGALVKIEEVAKKCRLRYADNVMG
jgi:hypothetical protein